MTKENTNTIDKAVAEYLSRKFHWVSSSTLLSQKDKPVVTELGADYPDLVVAIEGLKDEFGLKSKLTETLRPLKNVYTTTSDIINVVENNRRPNRSYSNEAHIN